MSDEQHKIAGKDEPTKPVEGIKYRVVDAGKTIIVQPDAEKEKEEGGDSHAVQTKKRTRG